MEVLLLVKNINQLICLFQRRRDGEVIDVDFADENVRSSGSARHIFQCSNFRCDGGCEEACLALSWWREDGKGDFEVGEHAAGTGGQEPVCFVQYHGFAATETCDCFFAGV